MMTKEEILAPHQFRHACKEFDAAKKIPEEEFAIVLETGRLSPSSFGFEPWKFVVVQNQALREKIKAFSWGAQGQLPTASHYVLILARKAPDLLAGSSYTNYMMTDIHHLSEEMLKRRDEVYPRFQQEDFELLENDRLLFEWACRQSYIAMANMMTVAAQMKIDSCPIEGFQKDKLEALLAAEGVLDQEHFGLSCMVAFGYRKKEPRVKTRRKADEVITWIR
ncbi:MAG: NAD(P)H-dependent oxidoreductase [Sporomusaceae bacterium]|nr:NAD(P)H-dependent oxidoreductase [Sporomusaceae bacterium]